MVRPSVVVRTLMFASAYAPLLLLMSALNSFHNQTCRWVFLGLAVSSVAAAFAFFRFAIPARNPQPARVVSAKPYDGTGLSYYSSYVVPFFVDAASTRDQRLALALFLGMTMVMYLRADLYYTNPLLALAGWRAFELDTQEGYAILSHAHRLTVSEVIDIVPLGGYVYVHLQGGSNGCQSKLRNARGSRNRKQARSDYLTR